MRRKPSKKQKSSSMSATTTLTKSACRSEHMRAPSRPKSKNASQRSAGHRLSTNTCVHPEKKTSWMNDPISTRDIDVTHYRNLQDQPLKKTKGGKRDTKGGKKLDKTQESTSDKQPKEIIIPKGDKSKFSYHGFMDRHYECRGPGIRRMEYTKKDFDVILRDVYKIFKNEPVLIDVAPPYTIVGDIHGQFNDLINIFTLLGTPPTWRYLFLGDYVDRGEMSLETIMLLFAYKVYYPESVILLRGNHECSRVNRNYGFLNECKTVLGDVYGGEIWRRFQDVFNQMPISALVATRILCMHGGISPNLTSLDELRNFPKPLKNPSHGVINDLLWSDPDSNVAGFKTSARGSGFVFGDEVSEEICRRFDIDVIVRAHQLQMAGYYISPNMRTISLFSAPNYCAMFKNAGAMLNVNQKLEMRIICMVPETKDCRDRIRLNNLVWDETVDKVPNLDCLHVVDETLKIDVEADKTVKESKMKANTLATTTTTTTTTETTEQ